MKQIGQLVTYLILAVNAFLTGMLILSAYSPYLHPVYSPFSSCLGLAFPIFLGLNLLFIVFWAIFYRRYALLSLTGLLVCISQVRTYVPFNSTATLPPEGSIKVLSYNVMSFSHLKKSKGRNTTLTYLAESKADIICLQEYSSSRDKKFLTEQDIKKALKAYPYQSIHRQNNSEVRLACFSKYPILSITPIQYKSCYNGSVKYELKVNSDTITVINNHLESNKLTKEDRGMYEDMINEPNAQKVKTGLRQLARKLAEASAIRASQADSVNKAIIENHHSTMIVCGDFNDGPISYPHRILTQHLNDAFTRSGNGLGISYNQNKFYFRIDNILISPNLKAYNCTVDRSITASDHYPIWCYISKQQNE